MRGGGVKINGGWEFSEKFNLTKQGSHNTTGCTYCGVRFLVGNFVPKMHSHKPEHLLFLLWPVIHYQP